jgi:hypothetical protein
MANSMVSMKAVAAPADKALVYFVRPNYLGFAINAAVYDGDKFIGIVPYDQKLPYIADPGAHTFMVVSEAADFMQAELLAGKTYYAEVTPRMGAWKARFSLNPVTSAEYATPEVRRRIDEAKQIENKPDAYTWAEKNQPSVKQKQTDYWAKWNEKAQSERPFLKAADGQ